MGKTRRKEKTFDDPDGLDLITEVGSSKKKGKNRKNNNLPPEDYKDSFEEDEYYSSFQKMGRRK